MISEELRTDRIIRTHMLWAMGAGLMPVPLYDIVTVTAIQTDLLKQLAAEYKTDYSASTGKAFVAALTGSTFARIGASAVKTIPVVGTAVGGVSMSVFSGASTYALGQVARRYFASGGDLSRVSAEIDKARDAFKEAFERGKQIAVDLAAEKKRSTETYRAVFEAVESLEKLRQKDLVTEEEFTAFKQKLLGKL